MKQLIKTTLLFCCICGLTACAESATKHTPKTFELSDVRLLESPFQHAQEVNKKYLLDLDANRLLAPFRREAGLPTKAKSYTSWENTGLDGHIGGHYLSALSLMYASTGDERIKTRLEYMVDELEECQNANADGYIGGVPGGKKVWAEVANGDIRAGAFDLNGKWVPLYNIHKTYAGLRDAFLYAHNEKAKEMLIKMTDWAIRLVDNLTEEQIQDMLRSEHGGLNETFADVAAITKNPEYLKLARKFSHQVILNPLLARKDELTGLHANTQIPKVLGYKRIADVDSDKEWSEAAHFFWDSVVENRSVCIGGNSVSEHFNPTDDFSAMINSIEGPETCNTYNMLRLAKMLYETNLDKKYLEYCERALYNHILSTQHPETGGLVYFTQMRPGHYRVYSQTHECMWCCVGSGIENHGKYGEMIYAHSDDNLFVNLFIPSRLNWQEKQVEIIQENRFPDEERTFLTINPKEKTDFNLLIRHPDWVKDGELNIFVNGVRKQAKKNPNGYVSIRQNWEKGDILKIELPMHIRVEQMPDSSNYYAFFYGPIALAAKTSTDNLDGLHADDRMGAHIAHGPRIPLQEIPFLVAEQERLTDCLSPVEGKPLTFRLANLHPAGKWDSLELVPFFRLHNSRYIIYWQQATADKVTALQQAVRQKEEEKRQLEEITVDHIIAGQQQPESDHFIRFENSATGYTDGVHWRDAWGWFSYKLRNKGAKDKFIYIAYLNYDRNRKTDIFINGNWAKSVHLHGDEDGVQHIVLLLPANDNKDEIVLRFSAGEGAATMKVTEVRLLDKEI